MDKKTSSILVRLEVFTADLLGKLADTRRISREAVIRDLIREAVLPEDAKKAAKEPWYSRAEKYRQTHFIDAQSMYGPRFAANTRDVRRFKPEKQPAAPTADAAGTPTIDGIRSSIRAGGYKARVGAPAAAKPTKKRQGKRAKPAAKRTKAKPRRQAKK